jgi:streptomycin 6-kinase
MPQAVAPAIPSDPGLPGARGMFGEDASRAIAAFLGARGWELEEARPVQAMYRPGRSCVVRYRARAVGRHGRRVLVVSAETRARERPHVSPPDRLLPVTEPVGRHGPYLVWAFPYDPSLRDLPVAADGGLVRERLAEVDDGPVAVSVQPLRYRPRRRAVFRYRILRRDRGERRWETAFGKILPRSKAERARAATASIAGGGGVRLSLPAAALGAQLHLFHPAEGRSLRDLLVAGGSLPRPDRVAAIQDGLAEAVVGSTIPDVGRPDAAEAATSTATLMERLVPAAAVDAWRVVDVAMSAKGTEEPQVRPIHGDLYEAQVFVAPDFSLGLIDLDDLGPGDPAMDAANFCAHLIALALSVPAAAPRLLAYRELVRDAFLTRLGIGPAALAWREAVAILLLATGPFRVLDPRWPHEVGRRVRLAVRLLETAEERRCRTSS